jgi:coenzyme F420-reducing hydrogenase beta subunit
MEAFISDLCLRNSCYDCKFSCNSQADITLGDFWAVPKEIKNEKGTSAVLVHTPKGQELLKKLISNNQIFAKEVTSQQITRGNPKLLKGIVYKPKKREKFLELLKTKDFDSCYPFVKKYLRKKRLKGLVKGVFRRLKPNKKN